MNAEPSRSADPTREAAPWRSGRSRACVRFSKPEAFVLPGAPFSGALSVTNDRAQRRNTCDPTTAAA